ncbi:hypothetical protein bpr_I0661 [Butyrivibrio proteoclasticus B316]|uniref:Uncharacterized protein n=1 Tax=Butyrivibrio proteoclasticus (strain ATCC 51982 / DSM 14932 / B316) TaxID=515622 RepID=E0S0T1_BUTPB|nr:hypothetical protein [Butyrivibrio proteoclasticus]ADL33406.1 hypothetical protein bpr_I0661 [Butyrivibrio proteoclasticus B316]
MIVDSIGTINDKEESAPKEVTRFLKDYNVDDKYPGADVLMYYNDVLLCYGITAEELCSYNFGGTDV